MAGMPPDDLLGQDLFAVLGLQHLADDEKAVLFEKIMQTLRNRVIARVFRQFSEEETRAFTDMAEQPELKNEALLKFFADHNVDLASLMLAEAVIYKAELIAMAQPYLQSSPAPVSAGGA